MKRTPKQPKTTPPSAAQFRRELRALITSAPHWPTTSAKVRKLVLQMIAALAGAYKRGGLDAAALLLARFEQGR